MPLPSLHNLLVTSGLTYRTIEHESAKSVELLSQHTGIEPSTRAQTAFAACSHTEIIVMAMEDYKRLVKPIIISGGFISADKFPDPSEHLVQIA